MTIFRDPQFWWFAAGLTLCAAETLAPGVYLLFFGFAALGVALTFFVAPLAAPAALLLFAVLCVLAVLLGRKIYGATALAPQGDPFDRAQTLVGRELTLVEPISGGEGVAQVGDSVWRVTGPDAPAGAQVRVEGVDAGGVRLRVAPV